MIRLVFSLALLFPAVGAFLRAAPELESQALGLEEALASIRVPEGFVVELIAAEPVVKDPVAFDWDTGGRLFVAEMADYPVGVGAGGKPGGRVRLLEDRNKDGRYEHSVLFAEGLSFPNGILTWRGGVIVTAAPDVIFLRDGDGDGRADEREVLLTGLSEGNQQLRANGLRWGFDNWVYVAAGGHHGGHAANTVVRSLRADLEMKVGSRDFRFRPDTGEVEPQSGPSQFGRNRDDWGRWFGTQNSRPLWHYVLPDHYLRRNPHLASPDGRVQLPGRLNPPVYPASRPQKRFHSFDQAGHYTSACSGMIYRDTYLFPRSARGESPTNAFACEPFHNLVQRLELEAEGVTFRGKRIGEEKEPDFFASTDRWCRPVMVRTGPDGCLWVADMYRYMIEHPHWLPKQGKEELLPHYRAGENRGRIYRVRRGDTQPRSIPRLAGRSLEEVASRLDSPNGWVRDKAQQELLWRADRAAVPLMRALVGGSHLPEACPHALGVLEGLGAVGEGVLTRALGHGQSAVREAALRFAERHATPTVIEAALRLVDDGDPKVRMQLAFSIGAFPPSEASAQALASLLLRDHGEPFAMIAALSSALPHLDGIRDTLSTSRDSKLSVVARPLIEVLLRAGRGEEVIQFLIPVFKRARHAPTAETVIPCVELNRLLKSQEERLGKLRKEKPAVFEELDVLHADLLGQARVVMESGDGKAEDQLAAATLLAQHPESCVFALNYLGRKLVPATPPETLRAVLAALGGTGRNEVPAMILGKWPQFSPGVRGWAVDELLLRVEWTNALLGAVRGGRVKLSDLDATRRLRLRQHPDAEIRKAALALLERGPSPARQQVVEKFRPALELKGSAERGEVIYRNLCVGCHRRGPAGREVGPDLRTVREHPPEKLLVNILNPNLDIQPGYHAYNCELKGGETLFGLLASENAVSITFKLPDGTDRVILRNDLRSLRSVDLSLMPDGLEAGQTLQGMADLIAFLKS